LALWAGRRFDRDQTTDDVRCFTQERVATNAGLFLEVCSEMEQRQDRWMRAEAAGRSWPMAAEAVLGRDDQGTLMPLRNIVRDDVVRAFGRRRAVWVITNRFLKQGKASAELGRQYTGSAARITNCQIGVCR